MHRRRISEMRNIYIYIYITKIKVLFFWPNILIDLLFDDIDILVGVFIWNYSENTAGV